MMMTRALREALACYQTATASKSEEEQFTAAERAQNFAVVAGTSAILTAMAVLAWFLCARCVGEVIGAALATAVPDISGWVTSQYIDTALSSAGYAASWALAAVALAAAERRLCGTMLEGLGMSPKE